MPYVFVSFACFHTGKNLGCCIVRVNNVEQANAECLELDLMPQQCNLARGYEMDEDGFRQQGMELNRFYSNKEMKAMGFEKDRRASP